MIGLDFVILCTWAIWVEGSEGLQRSGVFRQWGAGRSKCKNGRRSGRLEEYVTISEREDRGLYGGGVISEASGRGNERR